MSEPPATPPPPAEPPNQPNRAATGGHTCDAAAASAITTVVGVIGACTGTSGQQVSGSGRPPMTLDHIDDPGTDCAQMLPVEARRQLCW